MRDYKIYMHTFPNKKRYIGQTCQEVEKRWGNGRHYDQCPKIKNAIDKYGWDSVESTVLFDGLTHDEADEKEKEAIRLFDTINNGYNVSIGGNAPKSSYLENEVSRHLYDLFNAYPDLQKPHPDPEKINLYQLFELGKTDHSIARLINSIHKILKSQGLDVDDPVLYMTNFSFELSTHTKWPNWWDQLKDDAE